ncbi:MAG: hypothetical protein R3F33_09070 [Planctomycetota bacterium]
MGPAPDATFPPDQLFSVVQAAETLAVPVARIQKAMEQGELRFELVGRGEREVQRIRWVDLQDWAAPPVAAAPTPDPIEPEPVPVPLEAAGAEPQPGESSAAGSHPLAVPDPAGLPSPAQWQRGLEMLAETQEELRGLCHEWRRRWQSAEQERQWALEALLQRQTLLAGAPAPAPRPLWQRPATWLTGAAILALGLWMRSQMQGMQVALAAGQEHWAQQVQDSARERLAFEARREAAEREQWSQGFQQAAQRQNEQLSGLVDRLDALSAENTSTAQTVADQLSQARDEEAARLAEWQAQLETRELAAEAARQELGDEVRRMRDESEQKWQDREQRMQAESRRQAAEVEAAWKERESRAQAESAQLLQAIERIEGRSARQLAEMGQELTAARDAGSRAQQALRSNQRALALWGLHRAMVAVSRR